MSKKMYRGEPGGAVKVILPSGKSRPLRHVVLHSPIGFGWGYGGSGPADLAPKHEVRRILCDVLAERPAGKRLYHGRFKAHAHHQAFKREFVAAGSLAAVRDRLGTIADWLRKRGVEV